MATDQPPPRGWDALQTEWRPVPEDSSSPRPITAIAVLATGRPRVATVWRALGALDEDSLLHWEKRFFDGTFVPAEEGSRGRKNKRGQRRETDGTGRWSTTSATSSFGR